MKVNYLESRHIGLTEEAERRMLDAIGAESMESLVRETMPADILLPERLELEEPLTEQQSLNEADVLLGSNYPLAVICIRTMLTHIMLINDIVRKRCSIRIKCKSVQGHFTDFFKNSSIVNCLVCIFTPGKRTMTTTQNHINFVWIQTKISKVLYDKESCFFFVIRFYCFFAKIWCTRN